jgi:hypothetical protein
MRHIIQSKQYAGIFCKKYTFYSATIEDDITYTYWIGNQKVCKFRFRYTLLKVTQ